MEPSTWIAFGMFVVAAIATSINVIRAKRENRSNQIEESSAVIKAKAEMRLGSIEAAERVVAMYGSALSELQRRVAYLEKRVEELELENAELRSKVRKARSSGSPSEPSPNGPQENNIESILEEVRLEQFLKENGEHGKENEQQ